MISDEQNKIIKDLDRINSLVAETQANSDIGNCNLNEIYSSIEKVQEELKAHNTTDITAHLKILVSYLEDGHEDWALEKLLAMLKAPGAASKNQLRLNITAEDYNGGYHCTDDNYDPTPIDYDRAAYNPVGSGRTPGEAIDGYFSCLDEKELETDYIISGKDLI